MNDIREFSLKLTDVMAEKLNISITLPLSAMEAVNIPVNTVLLWLIISWLFMWLAFRLTTVNDMCCVIYNV